MHPFRNRPPRILHLIASAAVAGFFPGALHASETGNVELELAPFIVEAEFGIDGLRIQNSESVLNAHLLDTHGIGQLQDIAGVAPNLYTSNSDSRGFGDVFSLRGIANSIFFSAPSIALYIDDVPGGSVSAYPSTLLNVESFIVRTGPQGTSFGRNAPGGVIDIRTREPGGEHHGTLQVEYGSYDATTIRAAVDGPFADGLGYSASIGYDTRDGYIDNVFLDRTADDRRSLNARGTLHWKPVDGLQVRLGVVLENVDDDAPRLSSLASPDPFVVSSDLNGVTRMDRAQFSLQLRRDFPWGALVSTTSRQEWDLDPAATDLDLSSAPLAFSEVLQAEDLWTQEFRLESGSGAGLQWRAGLFYIDSTIHGDALREFVVPPGPFVPPGFVQTERTTFDLEQRSLAAYGTASHDLTDSTTFQLGLRLERNESGLDRMKESSNNFGFPVPPDPAIATSQDHARVSASAGLVHAVSDSLSLRVRSSLARKPEGYSAFASNAELARFGDERLWSSEVGLTFGPAGSRFGGSILAFWNDIEGYQFERTVPGSTDYVVVNADAVTTRGLEAKFMFHPVERVWWDFQAGFTDAKYDRHTAAAGDDLSGNRVPFVPRFTLRTGVTVDLGAGFSAGASYAAIGRTYYDERNIGTFSQPSHGIVNARLAYRIERWSATVHCHNVFGADYYQFINPEIFAGSPGAPRHLGVQLSYSY